MSSANVQKQVAGVELAELAHRIAARDSVSFGEALFKARREIEMSNSVQDGTTVQQNTGSPLRNQQPSSVPDPAKVREAVVEGLNAAPMWNRGGPEFPGMLNGYLIGLGVTEVSNRLKALGLGPQIISSIGEDLSAWLNNNGAGAQPSSTISKAADHVQQVYADAVKNKIGTQAWCEKDAVVLKGGFVPVDFQSVSLAERATQLAQQRNISFGEALTLARRGVELADDVIDPQQIADALTSSLKAIFATIFGGASQKIIDPMDVLKVKEQVDQALRGVGMGGASQAVTKAVEASLDDIRGVVQRSAIDGIIGKAVTAAQKAYTQAIQNS